MCSVVKESVIIIILTSIIVTVSCLMGWMNQQDSVIVKRYNFDIGTHRLLEISKDKNLSNMQQLQKH